MSNQTQDRNKYDVVSISHAGSKKRANHVQDALYIGKQQQTSGNFVKVFADTFLKHEAGRKSYF